MIAVYKKKRMSRIKCILEKGYFFLPGMWMYWLSSHGCIIDEAIDETGDWFVLPVSLRRLKSTVILRLKEWANVGCVNDTKSPEANLISEIMI